MDQQHGHVTAMERGQEHNLSVTVRINLTMVIIVSILIVCYGPKARSQEMS